MTDEEIEKDKKITEHPNRYGGDTVYECIKVLKNWCSPEEYKGFLKGTIIKYLCRLGKKDDNVQELKKAKFYLDKLIEFESEDNDKSDYICQMCNKSILKSEQGFLYEGKPIHQKCLSKMEF